VNLKEVEVLVLQAAYQTSRCTFSIHMEGEEK